ncbi:MAG: fused MFS/spermidine synthase [Mariprofundaceae bacterium]
MAVEVMGSRVVGPFFGVSLFVWTSLIAVTMIALAAGYALGGILADKRDSPDYLFAIILIAGLLVILIPFFKGMALKACMPLGLRTGAFVSTLLLFGPSLFMLGCVSPYIIRLATREMQNIGRTVGGFYAISTVGSVVGTALTGFVLIANFGVDQIFFISGMLLIALAVIYFLLFKRQWAVAALLFAPFFLGEPGPVGTSYMPDGTKVVEVYGKDSNYGRIKVVDYSSGQERIRELTIDGLVQGGIDARNSMSIYSYPYMLEYLPTALNPGGRECLVIGLGAGLIPRWYEAQGINTDIVDIDPEIIDIASDYMGFHAKRPVIIEDARYYLNSTSKTYDYIILDVFNGDITPGHVLSLEAFELMRQRMSDKGILAINLVGSLKEHTRMTSSVVKTLESIFTTVDIYPTFDPLESDGTGNIVILAHSGPAIDIPPPNPAVFPIHPYALEAFTHMRKGRYKMAEHEEAIILTDDYNPIDVFDIWLKEKTREGIIANTPWDILIS